MARGTDELAMVRFHDRLKELVNEAVAAGVDVEGSWPVLNGEDDPDWDVEIVSLARAVE